MSFDFLFGFFLGPLLLFACLTVRDHLRWRNREQIGFANWRYNLVLALVTQIVVHLFIRLRALLRS